MGTRVPPKIVVPPVAAGDACLICWGVGKPFGDGFTPIQIQATFSGINKGPNWTAPNGDPFDGVFMLDQNGTFPCLYELTDGIFFMSVEFRADDVLAFVFDNLLVRHFRGTSATECSLAVVSDEDNFFTGGSVVFDIPETF